RRQLLHGRVARQPLPGTGGRRRTIAHMNTRPASASTAVAHRSRFVVPVIALCRALLRVQLASQAVPIAGAFLCSYLLYGRIAGEGTALDWSLLGGLGSFIALFVELRLIDDLDDLERDCPVGEY